MAAEHRETARTRNTAWGVYTKVRTSSVVLCAGLNIEVQRSEIMSITGESFLGFGRSEKVYGTLSSSYDAVSYLSGATQIQNGRMAVTVPSRLLTINPSCCTVAFPGI